MQIYQRILLCIVLFVILVGGTKLLYKEQEEHLTEYWECIQAEQFISSICRTGQCTYAEYETFLNSLNYAGTFSKIELEEYQVESDLTGKHYRYPVVWSEILKCMMEEGVYYFRQGSVIEMRISRTKRLGNEQNRYYDFVKMKG